MSVRISGEAQGFFLGVENIFLSEATASNDEVIAVDKEYNKQFTSILVFILFTFISLFTDPTGLTLFTVLTELLGK